MSNNPKIKVINPSTKSGGIKFNSPDFQIDPNRQNDFGGLLDANQQEINLNECQYNLSPQNLNNTYNFQYWQFEFLGKGNFQGRKISGVLKFPPDFPKSAPKFYFDPLPNGQVIQHVNIYGDNLLCIPLLTHWNTQTSTMEILQAIEHIFANPNWGEGDAPANPPFNAKSEAERDNIQRAQAQFLPWFVKE